MRERITRVYAYDRESEAKLLCDILHHCAVHRGITIAHEDDRAAFGGFIEMNSTSSHIAYACIDIVGISYGKTQWYESQERAREQRESHRSPAWIIQESAARSLDKEEAQDGGDNAHGHLQSNAERR